jgi:glycosyltransferase involved in cell wall biosynthesis
VEAIKSANVEYVVIDGVSTDGTLELLHAHQHVIDKLICEPDTGVYNAMNKGIACATGKYILFINGDDELVPEGVDSVLPQLELGQSDIYSATTLVGSLEQPSEILKVNKPRLFFYNSVPHPSSFVKTEIAKSKPFDETLRIAADYDFFLWALMKGKTFRSLPVVVALHQRGGLSSNTQLSNAEIDTIRRRHLGVPLYSFLNLVAAVVRTVKKLVRRG